MYKSIASIAALALMASAAHADIVGGAVTGGGAFTNGGVFQELSPAPGFTVGNNQQQSNNLFGFNERIGVIAANITPEFGPNLLPNQRYLSHFIFFDPGPSRNVLGNVTFDREIVAVLASTANMNATDAIFGLAGINYQTPAARGLENNDSFNVVGNVLNVDFSASSPGDYIRVLTAVPEPESWAIMIAGFALTGAAMRRRRQQKLALA